MFPRFSPDRKVDGAHALFSHAISKLEDWSLGGVDLHLAFPTGLDIGDHQLFEGIDTT